MVRRKREGRKEKGEEEMGDQGEREGKGGKAGSRRQKRRESERRWKAQEELSGEGKDQWSPFVCCLASPLKACPERQ